MSQAASSDPNATYIIHDEWEIGEPVATKMDALTGRLFAYYRKHGGGFREVIIGEPLCDGCDAPVADGPCGCVIDEAIAAKQVRRAA